MNGGYVCELVMCVGSRVPGGVFGVWGTHRPSVPDHNTVVAGVFAFVTEGKKGLVSCFMYC